MTAQAGIQRRGLGSRFRGSDSAATIRLRAAVFPIRRQYFAPHMVRQVAVAGVSKRARFPLHTKNERGYIYACRYFFQVAMSL
jgi:hypothetical protein